MRKITFLLGGLLGQNVTFVSMLSFDLSGAGELEAFLCSGVGLHFWHYRRLLILTMVQNCFLRLVYLLFFLGIGAR